MAEWSIVPLDRSHSRADFDCGKPALDNFIRTLVNTYEKRSLGRTFVAVRPGEMRVDGYYTLASGSISFENLPKGSAKKLPKHPVPVVLLARLAVDLGSRGKGLGEKLLLDALQRSFKLGEELGIHAVEVDAIDEDARGFYAKYGFVPLLDRPLHLFLPIATIRQALGG